MKRILVTLLLSISLQSAELIHVSNSTAEDNLNILIDKYKKDIIINDNRAYIVPEECLVSRYFGGLSENKLNLPISSTYSAPIIVTQEVFEAKDVEAIEEQIQKQKTTDEVEGKVAKAFLEDKEGHLFGGLSQNPIDLTKQTKIVEIEKEMKKETREQKDSTSVHPTCKLLDDGTGYKLYKTINPKLYNANGYQPIYNDNVLFN